ncbi:MAG TPA: molybdate ABC transporter substrate-binding protein [Anaerolineae bacterium]
MEQPLVIRIALVVLGLVLAACNPTTAATRPAASTLKVFAAASLQDAFTEIGQTFEANNPGISVRFNYAGSQQLAQQISQGAPADVFASANALQMKAAVASGRIVSDTDRVFARNRLVVIVPGDNRAGLHTLQDLAKPALKIALAAKEVPAGQYALDFLTKTQSDASFSPGYRDAVLKNVVSYEENVRSVLSKVMLGEVDAGIVYTTDAAGSPAGKIGQIEIPDALNSVAAYPIAVLKDSTNATAARAFVDFVLSDKGQQLLAKYGFIITSGK